MARINHADFATIQIKDGMAHFRYDLGSGDTTTMVPQRVNDGEWHKVDKYYKLYYYLFHRFPNRKKYTERRVPFKSDLLTYHRCQKITSVTSMSLDFYQFPNDSVPKTFRAAQGFSSL